jgi:hypothetical protein
MRANVRFGRIFHYIIISLPIVIVQFKFHHCWRNAHYRFKEKSTCLSIYSDWTITVDSYTIIVIFLIFWLYYIFFLIDSICVLCVRLLLLIFLLLLFSLFVRLLRVYSC